MPATSKTTTTSSSTPAISSASFSDGVDDDGNGYVDDISGWDFFEGDNDPNDDVDYGHGTGEAEDSAGETDTNLDPQCPNCLVMPMRVGDSFVADVNHFAEAAIYATDNGASIIQTALGTLNNTVVRAGRGRLRVEPRRARSWPRRPTSRPGTTTTPRR